MFPMSNLTIELNHGTKINSGKNIEKSKQYSQSITLTKIFHIIFNKTHQNK
ncbi:hypothetical protein XSR1_370044 [Xenorhabdus szentirmaii DSM 16338]|uniref:Uncharacterized protein n=1 Tax=Xenorhabdus szentirmaii DSM 16338 TaxID=1427518 RepID=W1J2Z0_9GAMM|nr:hypothetical protein XSR1_370044 [Xenorhabdus szentirmaii DSM 16338]